jgi:hypothetical protein
MKVAEFRAVLSAHPETKMHWMLPDKSFVPDYYHITEVGRLQKDFILINPGSGVLPAAGESPCRARSA